MSIQTILLVVLAVAALILEMVLILALFMWVTLRLAPPSFRKKDLPKRGFRRAIRVSKKLLAGLDDKGFAPLAAFHVAVSGRNRGFAVHLYKHHSEPIYAYVTYLQGITNLGLLTVFADGGQLDTCSKPNFLPSGPGFYNQATRKDWTSLLQMHYRGLNCLQGQGKRPAESTADQVIQGMIDSSKRTEAYVRTIRFYPFRAVWWFFSGSFRQLHRVPLDQRRNIFQRDSQGEASPQALSGTRAG